MIDVLRIKIKSMWYSCLLALSLSLSCTRALYLTVACYDLSLSRYLVDYLLRKYNEKKDERSIGSFISVDAQYATEDDARFYTYIHENTNAFVYKINWFKLKQRNNEYFDEFKLHFMILIKFKIKWLSIYFKFIFKTDY